MRAKTKRLVRRLASLHGAESPIVSLYVDLDPGIAPDVNAKRRLIDSMLDEARRRARSTPETDERQVDADIAMVRAWVDEHPKLDDARGLAMFACAGQDVLEVVPMRAHV
jgi:peptide subunit release factor 1 (eRF1)